MITVQIAESSFKSLVYTTTRNTAGEWLIQACWPNGGHAFFVEVPFVVVDDA